MAIANEQRDTSGNTQSGVSGNQQSGQPQQSFALPIKHPARQPEATATGQQAQTQQPSPYDLRDLAAQEDMALWAMWMFVAAVATFAITSFGTLLIWRQVKLTRRAVEDTSEATSAMREANKIARVANERQLRAYVMVEGECATDFRPNGMGLFQCKLYNRGQTPAHDVRVWSGVFASDKQPEDVKIFRKEKRAAQTLSNTVIGPGYFVVHSHKSDGPLSPDGVHAVWAGNGCIVFAGVISYRDVFNKLRRTTFKVWLRGNGTALPPNNDLIVCKNGNSVS